MRGLASLAFSTLLLATAARPALADEQAEAPAPAPEAMPGPEPAATPEPQISPTAPLPPPAATNADRPENPTLRRLAAVRRGGVVIGVSPGIAFAGASGYPNNARLIGNPDFYSESPVLVGTSTTYFLMGALTDFVSFGPMVNVAKFDTPKWTSKGFGVGFRAELFPLVQLFPRLADLSLYGQAGVGSTELQAKGGDFPSADGTQSFVGLGVHHEFRLFRFLGGHIAGGPYVEYDAIFSTSAERHWASVGFRLAWYGGKVVLDKR